MSCAFPFVSFIGAVRGGQGGEVRVKMMISSIVNKLFLQGAERTSWIQIYAWGWTSHIQVYPWRQQQ